MDNFQLTSQRFVKLAGNNPLLRKLLSYVAKDTLCEPKGMRKNRLFVSKNSKGLFRGG